MMTSFSEVANDERTARMVLSMLIEPNDPVTGRILSRLGAVETLWLAERDGAVVGLSPVDAQLESGSGSVRQANHLRNAYVVSSLVPERRSSTARSHFCLDHMVRVGSTPPTVEQTSAVEL